MEENETQSLEAYENFIKSMEVSLGWTPLHCMAEKQNYTLASKLIMTRVSDDVDTCDNFDRIPLSIAAAKGNFELTELFFWTGSPVNEAFALHYACEKGNNTIVNSLIANGANVNHKKGETYPIIIASAKGHLEVVKTLIDHGADVNVTDEDKDTALHWACETGNKELISFLIDQGCDINAPDKFQLTPLAVCLVRMEDRPDLVKLLLEKGASVQEADDQNYTVLHSSGNPESTLELIKHGADVNAQNINKETPLYEAYFYKHFDCAKVLLEHGADPNIPAEGGWTSLHIAATEGNLEAVDELLKGEANVNLACAQNIIPLHCAAFKGHFEIVKKLLEAGSFIDIPVIDISDVNSILPYSIDRDIISEGQTPLSLAATGNHVEVCKLLRSHGANCSNASLPKEIIEMEPTTKQIDDWPCSETIKLILENDLEKIQTIDVSSTVDSIGWSLLHHSVFKGFYEMSAELINKGASVNAMDNYERTPLSIAASRNDVKLLKLLLDNDADVDLGLAIYHAVAKKSIECIQELINYNCNINIKTKKNTEDPVLVEAATLLESDIVKLLLENKADPNCSNKWKETALIQSCRFGDVESATALIKHGADVNVVDTFKTTPLICASFERSEIISILIENGADVHVSDDSQWTPLHHAASSNFEKAVIELIKAGASVNCRNKEGETPLNLTENVAIIKALIENGADVNAYSHQGWSALHENSYSGNLESVIELLNSKAKINIGTPENVLPIYIAAVKGHAAIVEELLKRGSFVDPSILDFGTVTLESGVFPASKRYHIVPGNTPLIGAASKGHLEVVKLLHSHKASLEACNLEGNTALHEAVLNNFEGIVEFLLETTVGVNVKNKADKTPMDIAKENANEAIIKLISSKLC